MTAGAEQVSITLSMAQEGLQRGIERACELECVVCIAVLDGGGHLLSYGRMDGAPWLCEKIATDKAYTAVGYGMPTSAWWPMISDEPVLRSGVPTIERLVIFGGGIPITLERGLLGAVGVSGRSTMEQDEAIAVVVANVIASSLSVDAET